MNENEMNANDVKDYEAPEVFEVGRADELTRGKGDDWPDGLNSRWMYAP